MISPIKRTYRDFRLFLRNPVNLPAEDQTVKHKISRLFSVLAMEIPIVAAIGAMIYGIGEIGLLDTDTHKIGVLFQKMPLWKFILFGVVVNPFIEELIFRLYLRFNPKGLSGYSLLSASAIGKRMMKKIEAYLTHLWLNKFHLVFFSSALLFAIFHLSNYQFSITVLLLSPLLVAPQFITGLFLGYLRIKYSWMLGYFMHAIHNAFFISSSLIIINSFDIQ